MIDWQQLRARLCKVIPEGWFTVLENKTLACKSLRGLSSGCSRVVDLWCRQRQR